MKHLSIDIETYSGVDLGKSGLYAYCESPDFQIMLFAYSVDFGAVKVVDFMAGESLPVEIVAALNDASVIKHAFNAAFEIHCLQKAGYSTSARQWQCTMVHAYYLRFAGGLQTVSEALRLPSDKQKDKRGRALIRFFSQPCKPTKNNSYRTRNLPEHAPEKWQEYKEYNAQDVVAEMSVLRRLAPWSMPAEEWDNWYLDQEINDRGVKIDLDLVRGALNIDTQRTAALSEEAAKLSGLKNPNSVSQLKWWIKTETGREVESLDKAAVAELIKQTKNPRVKRVLEIRQELGKASVSKYTAMQNARSSGDRVRGLLQFYGAGTGRWAGRLVQVQNLPRNKISGKALDLARDLVKTEDATMLEFVFGSVQDTLSQLIRTAFVPKEGHHFLIADYSAIEARVIAWLAGETWRQEVFAGDGKIYEASAAQMFGVPVETIVHGHKNYALRAKGKVAELALGYQGSVGALIQMGALDMGLTEDELPEIVNLWRARSPAIVDLWYSLQEAAGNCLHTGREALRYGLRFKLESSTFDSYLTIELPSGRKLFYPDPHFSTNKFGNDTIGFWNINQTTRKWEPSQTYGGKLTENVVQAIARDCLALSMRRLAEAGFHVVMHIHDEVVIEHPIDHPLQLEDAIRIMTAPIDWAPGLILNADGFIANYYQKD